MKPGVAAVAAALPAAQPAVHLVEIDDIPRAALTPAEFAAIFGTHAERILDLIASGHIEVLPPGTWRTRSYRIPVTEIGRLAATGVRLDPRDTS